MDHNNQQSDDPLRRDVLASLDTIAVETGLDWSGVCRIVGVSRGALSSSPSQRLLLEVQDRIRRYRGRAALTPPATSRVKSPEAPVGYCSLSETAVVLGITMSEVCTMLGDGRLESDRFHDAKNVVYVRKESLGAYQERSGKLARDLG